MTPRVSESQTNSLQFGVVLLACLLQPGGGAIAPSRGTAIWHGAAAQGEQSTAAIQTAFRNHCDYFASEMRRRLAKDNDGNSDTYVLYDVQMHMQNAAIYADERDDRKMLTVLLDLCMIPFERQFLSKGKWLNNRYGLVGVEVDLCIAQYFSLMTRVLSACQRHRISMDFSKREIAIVVDHIDHWIAVPVNRNRVDDRHLFFVQSILQFSDYLKNAGESTVLPEGWRRYVQDYLAKSIEPKWEVVPHTVGGKRVNCWMLDRTGWVDHPDNRFAGYGREITRSSSDTDPKAMFRADGTVKQPPKKLPKVATDVSHARRFNWFFETVQRFGRPFDVTIGDAALQGWADNLAWRVCRGTLDNPHFTVFSDGVDGWYRVGYAGRKNFGYTLGDMDLHFVASSYGMFGVYNPRIRQWIRAWAAKHQSALDADHGGYALDYQTSLAIDLRQPLAGMDK